MAGQTWIAFGVDMVAILSALVVTPRGSLQRRLLLVLIALSILTSLIPEPSRILGYAACAVAAALTGIWSTRERSTARKRWLMSAATPLLLRAPFRGEWRVAAGGPDPMRNHHQVATDQYFAYDFVCANGVSWGKEILSPCDGVIAWAEDAHDDVPPNQRHADRSNPAGNYVSIETPRGYVILAHLKKGSVAVREGEPVAAGDTLGRCGNSGNTTRSHLHIHAQDRPRLAVNVATGIPIAFVTAKGHTGLVEYGDTVSGEPNPT